MPHPFLILGLVGSALGVLFSAVSTYDFVAHLDRQVHGLHCSFLPGVIAPDVSDTSGCHVTLMSPYSSIFRESLWGGIPIALPALAVFAFLLFWGALLWLTERVHDTRATGFYATASCLPLVASIVMATIAVRELDAFCKICVGMYLASVLTAIGAFGTYRRAERARRERAAAQSVPPPLSYGALAIAFAVGCVFVGTSTLSYALNAPDFSRYVARCGRLESAADPHGALLPLGPQGGRHEVLEVLDPLCPACRAFERRFDRLALREDARRSVLLFPLDNTCNWMVDRAVHPGACVVSEALLCAGDDVERVLAWAFDEQESLREQEAQQRGSAKRRVVAQFPALASCIGSTKVRARLNRALRWAVDNHLPVLTPQLYVDGARLCDADTDLGLDYMLDRLGSTPPPPPLPKP